MYSVRKVSRGRLRRMHRRYQVRAWWPRYKPYSGPFTYYRTRPMATLGGWFFAALGYQVELWDMGPRND